MNWKGAGTSSPTSDQVPTEVYYTNPETRDYKWGYQVRRVRPNAGGSGALRWFKLLVQPQTASDTPIFVLETAERLQRHRLSLVDAVTDFLKSVLELIEENMTRTYREWAHESRRLIIMTVPAIWGDYAKALMTQAAENAGFGTHRVDFKLISEPESAASYTLKAIQPNHLNVDVPSPSHYSES
jgi:hypothetical protein